MASAVVFRNDDVTIRDQHKNSTDLADIALSHVITATRGGTTSTLDASELGSSSSSSSSENNKITIATCRAVYPQVIKFKLTISFKDFSSLYFNVRNDETLSVFKTHVLLMKYSDISTLINSCTFKKNAKTWNENE